LLKTSVTTPILNCTAVDSSCTPNMKPAVACYRDHRPVGVRHLGAERGRNPEPSVPDSLT